MVDSTAGLVSVGVVARTEIPDGGTRPGLSYGMPNGHVLPTKHIINVFNLEDIQSNQAYWKRWMNFTMDSENVQKLIDDTGEVPAGTTTHHNVI
jgi:hypothetical protein